MSEKVYYYLKLEETYFNNKIEKALRKMPSGSDMLICYLKMQLKYIRSEGFIIHSGIYNTLEEEISLEIDEDVNIIKMLLIALMKWGYVEKIDNGYYLSDMQKRVGTKTDIALRVERHREKVKLLSNDNSGEDNCSTLTELEYKAKQIINNYENIPKIDNNCNNKRYGGNYYLVMQRDKMQCSICNSKENICVHHMDGFYSDKPENNKINKLLVLCRECHSRIHAGKEIPQNILDCIKYNDVTCNNNVTQYREEKELELEKNKEIDISTPKIKLNQSLNFTKTYFSDKKNIKELISLFFEKYKKHYKLDLFNLSTIDNTSLIQLIERLELFYKDKKNNNSDTIFDEIFQKCKVTLPFGKPYIEGQYKWDHPPKPALLLKHFDTWIIQDPDTEINEMFEWDEKQRIKKEIERKNR